MQPKQRRIMRFIVFISVWLTGVSVGFSAQAEPGTHNYNLPAQPLNQALMAVASQSKVEIIFPADLVRGVGAQPLSGAMTLRDALDRLLKGSSVTYRFVDDRTVTLEKRPAVRPDNGATLRKVTVTGKTGDESTSYKVSNAATATKTDTPIMQTPMSIQVVPKAMLEDQQVITVEDAVKNVSGVQRSWGYGSLYDAFYLRGFQTGDVAHFGNYRNGFKIQNYSAETANVESIEVLKGPAAMLYGRTDPGGMINIITKKPLDYAYYSLQQQFGSYDFYRTSLDATGPLNSDKSLLYRFNLAYTGANSFRDAVDTDRIFIAPSLTWRISDATEINLNFEYKKNAFTLDNGIPALNGAKRPANVPIDRFLGEPGVATVVEDYLMDLNWSHRFSDGWKLKGGFVSTVQDYDLATVLAPRVLDDNQNVRRFANFSNNEHYSYGSFLDLTGQFDTFGIKHDVLLGTDWYHYTENNSGSFRRVSDLSIFNPVYGSVSLEEHRAFRDYQPNNFWKLTDEWFGLYFQDQITLWDKLHILGGGRHDWARSTAGWTDVSLSSIDQAITDTARFQPRTGIVYQPWDWLSLFGNYVESFGSSNGITMSGAALPPETAEQFEGGVKTDWLNGRLSSTLAYFHIEKNNLLTADPSAVIPNFATSIGRARSRGVELDVKGKITDNLSLIATYAFTDARITKSSNGDVGNRLPNVPENSGSLWAKYDFNGSLEGLSLGSGAYVAGQREGDNANTLQLPGYVRWDAMAAYRFKVGKSRLTTQLNVNNILDKRYYKNTDVIDGNPRGRILPAEPLTLMGSVRLEF